MKKNIKRMLMLWSLLFFNFVFLELVFKLNLLVVTISDELFFLFAFSLSYSSFILFILMFFREKTIKFLTFVIVISLSVIFFLQDIYHTVVENFFSIQVAGDFSLGLSFIGDAFLALRIRHLLYIFPIIIIVLINSNFKELYKVEYKFLKQPLIILIFSWTCFFLTQEFINDNRIEDGVNIMFTDKDLYEYVYDNQKTVKTFGLVTYLQRDILNVFRVPPLREAEYRVLLEDFLSSRNGHTKNQYSDVLEGKNLILIMAESLDTFAIHPILTPTLYDLKSNYAYFENYYSPLYYRSTADTEWMVQTSLFPNKNVTLSMEAYVNNTLPNTLPNLFEVYGYNTYSYHNYIDYFYNRTDAYTNLFGYDIYRGASDLGLLDEVPDGEIIFDHKWQRDLDLINLTIDEYINDEKFFVNYITVSGHFNYDQNHEVFSYHEEKLSEYFENSNESIPEDIYYYLATAMELDLSVKTLMDKLGEANKLQDTAIIIYGDHYAYAINEEDIWAYDNSKSSNDPQTLHNVPMLIYTPEKSLSGNYNQYFSSIDIMPTIANLYGLPMKYEFAFGVDVFSIHNEHIIKFADNSYRSKNYIYDALTETYSILNEDYDLNYLISLSQSIINDYRYNTLLLDYDYFKEKEE